MKMTSAEQNPELKLKNFLIIFVFVIHCIIYTHHQSFTSTAQNIGAQTVRPEILKRINLADRATMGRVSSEI